MRHFIWAGKKRGKNEHGAIRLRVKGSYTTGSELDDVHSAEFVRIAGIGLDIIGYLLAFVQRLEAIANDRGEVHEYIVAALVIGDKTEALFRVEPFYCSLHFNTS